MTIEDIENLAVPDSNSEKRISETSVPFKRFRKPLKSNENVSQKSHSDHFLPGTQSIWVKTWGCGHNNSDGEYMAGLLAAQGYKIIFEDSKKNDADVWLLNSCTVKGPSEQTFVNEIRKGKDSGKHVVVAGCVPQANPKGKEWLGLSVVGVQQIDRVVEVVEETIKGHTVRVMREKKDEESKKKAGGATLDLPKIRKNPFIEIIPINTGCLNQCTYCKTKHARGDLGSYPPNEIIDRVKTVLAEGVVEIWLTSEDLGAYGRDIGVKITDLLWAIVEAMEQHDQSGLAMLRVGMTNPPYILEHLEEMCKILNHPRVYSFLHVPVQAASDKVLEDMRRQYTQAEFRKVADTLIKNVPGITIATDVICGFPTETPEDFEQTLDLVRDYKFPVLHISQFYPRPGTPASRLSLLNSSEVKSRSRALTSLFESYSPYSESLIGTTIEHVLITDQSHDGVHVLGHDKSFRQILIPIPQQNGDVDLDFAEKIMGRKVDVTATGVGKFHIEGDLKSEIRVHGEKKKPKYVRKKREIVRVEDGEDEISNKEAVDRQIKNTETKEQENNVQQESSVNLRQTIQTVAIILGFIIPAVALLMPRVDVPQEWVDALTETRYSVRFAAFLAVMVIVRELVRRFVNRK